MSDDDDDFMQESDNEEYEFEYEDDDGEEGGDIGIENKYYNAKQMKADNPEEAIDEFLGMPAMEAEKGDWQVSTRTRFLQLLTVCIKGVQRPEASHQIEFQT